MKSILITGGCGFIGSNLAIKFLKKGYEVTIYDNMDKFSGANIFNLNPYKKYFKIIKGDILNFNLLSKSVVSKSLIINCAASTSHIRSMHDPLSNLDVNIKGVLNILESIKLFNLDSKFIQIGATTQIGDLQKKKADELHPEFPKDIYSANKMIAEKYVDIYSKSYKIKAITVRLPNTFGPRAAINNSELTFNNYFMGQALQKKVIKIYGNGKQLRNIIFIDDIVEAIYKLSKLKFNQHEVYLGVSDFHYSLADIAIMTSKVFGSTTKFVKWPNEAKIKEIGNAILSNKKIKKRINWQAKIDLQTGLEISLDYYLKYKQHYI